MLEYLVIVLGVAVFGLQHSGIASLRVKYSIIDRWGKGTYGNIYKVTSILALLFAFLLTGGWDWFYFITAPETVNLLLFVPGIVLIVAGLVISSRASSIISVSSVADMRTDRDPELITDGIYARIRHPLYLATIFMFIGLALIYPFLNVIVFSASLIAYTIVGAVIEERKLVMQYDEKYLGYKKRAGFLLPKFRRE
jgi:protein-S-isoprenylcysteine O-methyltransferase Ste14